MGNAVRKNIDMSETTIANLKKLADMDKRKLKPYIEMVLEKHSKKAEKIKLKPVQ